MSVVKEREEEVPEATKEEEGNWAVALFIVIAGLFFLNILLIIVANETIFEVINTMSVWFEKLIHATGYQ